MPALMERRETDVILSKNNEILNTIPNSNRPELEKLSAEFKANTAKLREKGAEVGARLQEIRFNAVLEDWSKRNNLNASDLKIAIPKQQPSEVFDTAGLGNRFEQLRLVGEFNTKLDKLGRARTTVEFDTIAREVVSLYSDIKKGEISAPALPRVNPNVLGVRLTDAVISWFRINIPNFKDLEAVVENGTTLRERREAARELNRFVRDYIGDFYRVNPKVGRVEKVGEA